MRERGKESENFDVGENAAEESEKLAAGICLTLAAIYLKRASASKYAASSLSSVRCTKTPTRSHTHTQMHTCTHFSWSALSTFIWRSLVDCSFPLPPLISTSPRVVPLSLFAFSVRKSHITLTHIHTQTHLHTCIAHTLTQRQLFSLSCLAFCR